MPRNEHEDGKADKERIRPFTYHAMCRRHGHLYDGPSMKAREEAIKKHLEETPYPFHKNHIEEWMEDLI